MMNNTRSRSAPLGTRFAALAMFALAACGGAEVDPSSVGQPTSIMEKDPQGVWDWQGLTVTRPVLNRLWGSSANDVWGVGNNSVTVHWDGTTWRRFPNPSKATLRAIWGTASNNIWAVGDDSTIMRWNGTAWSMVTGGAIPTAVALNDVYAISANDVWVVGDEGVILRYNGTTWSGLTPPALNNLITVWGASGTNVWIGGDLGMLLRWNGTTLSEVATGSTEATWRIRGSSSGKAWMSVEGGNLKAWDGTNWSAIPSVYGNDIWVGSDTNVWMLTSNTTSSWNGMMWSTRPAGSVNGYRQAFWITGATDGWMGDHYGNIYRYVAGMGWSRSW
jgi:hypothetical protein